MNAKYIVVAMAIAALAFPSVGQSVKFKVLHNFGSSQDGNHPSGPLLLDSAGNLYGATGGGPGLDGYGVAFELTPLRSGGWKETLLHAFVSTEGSPSPWGAFIEDSAGNLYGTTIGGPVSPSEAYELSPSTAGWTHSTLYTDGAGPGLLMDSTGNLYGFIGPGQLNDGAIGELSPGSIGWTYSQLYSLCNFSGCPEGVNALAPPIWDEKGNLWGTTFEGGIGRPACTNDGIGCGVIYAMTPNSDGTWTYHVVHRFASSPTDGQFPAGGLVVDPAGSFYGSTEGGGPHNNGTIFRLGYTAGKWKGTMLFDFPNCLKGCYPMGTIVRDSAGNLYGMAQGGPNNCGGLSCGVVYRLSPQSNGTWKYSVLIDLSETTGGVLPFYGLTLDGKGNLYGVTDNFGKYGGGTVFEITQ